MIGKHICIACCWAHDDRTAQPRKQQRRIQPCEAIPKLSYTVMRLFLSLYFPLSSVKNSFVTKMALASVAAHTRSKLPTTFLPVSRDIQLGVAWHTGGDRQRKELFSSRPRPHSGAMALKIKQSIASVGLVQARPVLPLGLRPRLAAVSHLQHFARTGRIAQLLRAAAQEVETETFDVSWGSADPPGANQDPAAAVATARAHPASAACMARLLQLQPRSTGHRSHVVTPPSQQACCRGSDQAHARSGTNPGRLSVHARNSSGDQPRPQAACRIAVC